MKRFGALITATVALASGMAAYGQNENRQFTINGIVSNVPDSCTVLLWRENGAMLTRVGEAKVTGGRFTLTGEAQSDCETMSINSNDKGFPSSLIRIWVAPGETITIEGDGKLMPIWKVTSDIAQQQSYNKMNDAKMPEYKRYLELKADESELIQFLYGEKKGAQEYIKPTWAKIDSIRAISDPLDSIMDVKVADYMRTASVDEIWLDQLKSFATGVVMGWNKRLTRKTIDELYGRMSEEDKNTPDGKVIEQYLTIGKILEEGDDMIDGTLYDAEGKEHSLAEHKGKYILLDFWSAGCGPCIMSIPEAEEVAEEYADRLAIVSISSDPEEIWKKTLTSRNMKGYQWNQLNGENVGLYQKYGTTGIPHYVLINPEGKIQKKWSGYGKGSLKKAVSEQLKQK